LLRSNDGVQLGFETLSSYKFAMLELNPLLTFDEDTMEMVTPTRNQTYNRIMSFAEEFYIELHDVNRTRKVSTSSN
jgi:hypothetical protein